MDKFARNVQRDADTERLLLEGGWTALVIWECETRDAKALAERLWRFLSEQEQRRTVYCSKPLRPRFASGRDRPSDNVGT